MNSFYQQYFNAKKDNLQRTHKICQQENQNVEQVHLIQQSIQMEKNKVAGKRLSKKKNPPLSAFTEINDKNNDKNIIIPKNKDCFFYCLFEFLLTIENEEYRDEYKDISSPEIDKLTEKINKLKRGEDLELPDNVKEDEINQVFEETKKKLKKEKMMKRIEKLRKKLKFQDGRWVQLKDLPTIANMFNICIKVYLDKPTEQETRKNKWKTYGETSEEKDFMFIMANFIED